VIDLFGRQSCIEHLFKPPSPISSIWLAELARLLPEIRQHWPEMPAPVAVPPEEERRRLFEAFTQALRVLENRPLVLFIDDLHWVDQATLDWLIYLVNRMRDGPLLLVCAYRSDEAAPQLVSVVAEWNRDRITRQLPLHRLLVEESTKLIAAIGGDVARTEQLLTQSAGNPYFLIELSQEASDVTPPGLAEMVRTRLGRLPDINRQVLQAAALLEAGFEFATLRRTGGRGEEETLDALDALLDAHILSERQGRFEFVHPLVATVIRRDLSIPRRSFLHRRAAEAMEAIYVGRLELIAGQLATHYSQAGRQAQAAHYAALAAERALDLTAPAEAVAFYQQALSLEPTLARRMGLGQALYVQGDLESARETFCSALAEFEAQGDGAGAVRACLALAETYLPSGQGDKVIDWTERALPNLDAKLDPEAHARVHYLLGAGGLMSGVSLSEAEAHLSEASSLATGNNLSEMAARSQFELGNLLAQRGDLEKALQAFENAVSLSNAAGNHFLEILGQNNLAYHAQLAGDLATAREHIETGLSLAEAHDLLIPRQYLYSTRGEIALAERRFDEAEAWFTRGLREAERQSNNLQVANIRANLGLVAQARGDLDRALMLLKTACAAVAAISAPPQHLQIQIDLWLAELNLRRGERAAADEALSRAETHLVGGERQGLREWAKKLRTELQQ
jgi:tetratricopeptide (TPR) repeat protein